MVGSHQGFLRKSYQVWGWFLRQPSQVWWSWSKASRKGWPSTFASTASGREGGMVGRDRFEQKMWIDTSRISQSASKMEKPCITTVVAGGWALSGQFHRFLLNIWDLGWFPIPCKHLISHFRMLFPGSTLLVLSEVMAMLAGGKTTAAMVRTSGAFKRTVSVHQVPKKSTSI